MTNHEFGSASASHSEAPRIEGAELPRPKLADQAHSLAIRTLHAARRHYKEAIAVTIATIGLQSVIEPDSAHADMHQIEQPVGGLYQAYLPIAGKGADFRIVLPGHTPTPFVEPTEPSPSPTARPSEPKPTATEVPATTTPEKPHAEIGLDQETLVAFDTVLDPFAFKQQLEDCGFTSTPDNLITFDAEAEGTGAILATDGTPVAYRLLLKDEQKPDEKHFVEISIDALKKAVNNDAEFQRLLAHELKANEQERSVKRVIAHDTKFHNAIKTSNPIDAEKVLFGEPRQDILASIAQNGGPQTFYALTKEAQKVSAEAESVNSPDQDDKVYGSLKPVAVNSIPYPNPGVWHTFTESFQVLPADTGFTINFNMQFKDNAIAYLDYLADDISPNPSGIGVVVSKNSLFVGNFHQGAIDGPYVVDTEISQGDMNVSISINQKRNYAELTVTDSQGKKTHYKLPMMYPMTQTNTMGIEINEPLADRGNGYVQEVSLEIPANPDRLLAVKTDTVLRQMSELNEMDDAFGEHVGIVQTHGVEGSNHDGFYMGGLVQNANTDMLMIDHSAVNDPDNQIQRAGDGIIQKRQFANAELHQYVEDRRAENPNFFVAYSYDMSSKPIYEGYKPQDFWRDFELAHQGADLMGDALVDSPTGLIGIGGGFGDYVDKIIQPGALENRARQLGKELARHMPEGAILRLLPQLRPDMRLSSANKDTLLAMLNGLNAHATVEVQGVIVSANPAYSIPSEQYTTYLLTLQNALNTEGYVMDINHTDTGILSQEQIKRIRDASSAKRPSVALMTDPRSQKPAAPNSQPALGVDRENQAIFKTETQEISN